MKTVKAHIEQGKDGSFGIYTEHGDLPFLVIGDGKTLSQAKDDFKPCNHTQKGLGKL